MEYCIANGQWTNNNYRIIKSEELKPALNTLLNSKKWQKELTRSEKAFFEEQIDTTSEHLIYQGRLVEIFVEKAIYHSPTNDNFLMRFLIKNISAKLIGVDLTDFRKTIYPNQWGIYTKPYREVVDERAYAPDTMINQAELLKKFKDNSLTIMPPNETLEYYRDWNGGAEKVELKNREDYLIISVAGQLLFTNGADFEDARLLTAAEKNRAVVFDYPINNKTIPEKSLIIGSN
ncbi:MAG: hypothetical protein KJ620_10445 [Candidatus Edwardsbacteria bacterium]|nr:hypothetical protein [Candidatus Edwardsbacteria bacterium]MBU1576573.1 hypothetical protein [Candidatus Edwardsbacteria bacterium]MBU2463397.1 hypothetical protein [Candidatus Edwardsbacteria bacterium]MBU2594752.1 hypothetical protein [Candidatus Edwardsbacteria bacterium]